MLFLYQLEQIALLNHNIGKAHFDSDIALTVAGNNQGRVASGAQVT